MNFYTWIILVVFGIAKVLSVQDINLSIENSTKSEYTGYVWAKNKFVFLTPYLRAIAVRGRSISEKICGFELSSSNVKTVPFMVYLVDELSGLGEIQVKPHIDLDHQKETVMRLTVEAYDCDQLPHYSNRVRVAIHISKYRGPSFEKSSYSFSTNKDSPIGSVVGTVKAKGTVDQSKIGYSLYHVGDLPFGIDENGVIRTLSTLRSLNDSLMYLRVVATEQSAAKARQSIASISIEIQPICENKLTGIPDQLDYKIKGGTNSFIEPEQLIQEQHQPRLTICYLKSPFKQARLEISLIQSTDPQVLPTNVNICQTNIAASRLQRRVCDAPSGTQDLFLTQGGIIQLNEGVKKIGPEFIQYLKDDFTFTWWMKRNDNLKANIFSFQGEGLRENVSLYVIGCNIVIAMSSEEKQVAIPPEVCTLDTWLFYTLSQEWSLKPLLRITVADKELAPLSINKNIPQFQNLRIFIGQCPSSEGNVRDQLGLGNPLQIGVVSLSRDASFTAETVGCMSTCGEALLASVTNKKWPDISVERHGSSLHFTSTSIPEIVKMLSKIDYVNSYYSNVGKQKPERVTSNVAIDIFIDCKSGETISVPRTLINVNIILPQRDHTNDTMDVDIYVSSTIFSKLSKSIRLFPDLRFVDSVNEEPLKRNIKIEACSIRPLQRNFIPDEKIYMDHLMMPIVIGNKLRIKYDPGSWNLEGDGSVELYESLMKHVTIDVVNERRKLFVICTLRNGELTSQAFVDVILPRTTKMITITNDSSVDFDHNSLNERKEMIEQGEKHVKDQFNITKSKFIAVVIMAVVGGAAWAVVTAAVTCFIIRRRGNLKTRNRIKQNNITTFQRESSPTFFSRQQSASNLQHGCTQYEFDEDRVSMADIPDADEHCLDHRSCDTCNMTDHETGFNGNHSAKDIPRSKTINFPIVHKRF